MKKVNTVFTIFTAVGIAVFGLSFSGCTAMDTAIKKRDLQIQTKMSETIFLEPLAPQKRIVYLDIRNTSDQEMHVREGIIAALKNRGYRVTDNPEEANYMLQGNILKVAKSTPNEASSHLGSGFDSALSGAAIGAGASYALGGSGRSTAGAALAGAAIGFVGDALASDVMFVMVTDLQIRERPLAGEVVTQTQKASLAQGSSTVAKQEIKGGKIEWKTYRTRIVSTANKMNLEFEEAKPSLESALVKSISGIF